MGPPRRQPDDGVAAVLLRQPDRRSDQSRSPVQARPGIDPEPGRRQDLRQRRRRRARRLPRRVDRPEGSAEGHRRRRRRPVVVEGRRQPLVEVEQPADLAVLSRERRQRRSVPRLRRPAGQQFLGRRFVVSRAASPIRVGKTCTAATASGCSPIRRIRTSSTPRRRAARSVASTASRTSTATSSRARTTRKSCAGTGTRRSRCRRPTRTPSTSVRSSCSARATTARPGTASRRT